MAHEALPPVPHDRAGSRWPSPRELSILAAAFELTGAQVLDDAACVAAWTGPEAALLDLLAHRHAWDRSVPPYYLAALRRVVAPV
jgi:hypothetical protein